MPAEKVNRLLAGLLNICDIFSTSQTLKFFINIKDYDGDTPLHLAAKHGYLVAYERLKLCGADTSLRNNEDLTAWECLPGYVIDFSGPGADSRPGILCRI